MRAGCAAACTAGRAEFVEYLPEATQGVIVQPLGNQGVLVVGTDTLRGLSRLDQASVLLQGTVVSSASPCVHFNHCTAVTLPYAQAWIAVIADKLEVSLEGWTVTGTGFGSSSTGARGAAAARTKRSN